MKVYLDEDEYWPYVHEPKGADRRPDLYDAVEVDVETAERWRRVLAEHDEVQDEMSAALKAAREL